MRETASSKWRVLGVRLKAEDMARVEDAAKAAGKTVSTWAKEAILEVLDTRSPLVVQEETTDQLVVEPNIVTYPCGHTRQLCQVTQGEVCPRCPPPTSEPESALGADVDQWRAEHPQPECVRLPPLIGYPAVPTNPLLFEPALIPELIYEWSDKKGGPFQVMPTTVMSVEKFKERYPDAHPTRLDVLYGPVVPVAAFGYNCEECRRSFWVSREGVFDPDRITVAVTPCEHLTKRLKQEPAPRSWAAEFAKMDASESDVAYARFLELTQGRPLPRGFTRMPRAQQIEWLEREMPL